MKYTIRIILALVLVLVTSCISDDTSLATRPLSEITITKGTVRELYNICKNDSLIITPAITQSNVQKAVTYTWEVDQKVVSHDAQFRYFASELGTRQCRLIVENEDGKTFCPFTISIVSRYEEGIAILSCDESGKSMLSFLLDKASVRGNDAFDTEADDRSFIPNSTDAFSFNNPDAEFADRAIDMVQSGTSLIIACQGHRTAANPNPDQVPVIYYLNNKTFMIKNMLSVPEYEDFIPTRLAIPSLDASGVAYPVLCENGKVYEFSTTEGALSQPAKFQSTYAQTNVVWDNGSSAQFDLIFWDKNVGGLCEVYNGYGPYYCGETYHLKGEDCKGAANYFDGQDIVKMMNVSQTAAQAKTQKPEILVLTSQPFGPMKKYNKTRLYTHFWDNSSETKENYLSTNGGMQSAGAAMSILVGENTPCVANQTYNSMLFGSGNALYRWYYTTSQFITDADKLQTFGSADAKVTDLLLSADHARTYVAVNDPADAPMTGSIYVVDTDNGTIIESYKGIAYNPVRIVYKK